LRQAATTTAGDFRPGHFPVVTPILHGTLTGNNVRRVMQPFSSFASKKIKEEQHV
jgi:hypothetical protein